MTTTQVATQSKWQVRRSTSTTATFSVTAATAGTAKAPSPNHVKLNAIHSYLQAVRELGKQQISSSDVANALDLPEREVRRLMTSMTEQGVKAR
jgi:hypothetical protein